MPPAWTFDWWTGHDLVPANRTERRKAARSKRRKGRR